MTDYITGTILKATISLTGQTYADADITTAIAAACRGIDKLCRRRGTTTRLGFQADADTAQVRYYSPVSRKRLAIDDLVTLTTLATDPSGGGTFSDVWTVNTDFVLDPLNAAAEGRPYEKLLVHPNGGYLFPTVYPRGVKVTGKFGWPAVPDEIVEASTILAAKLLKRAREVPFGVVAINLDGAAVRLAKSDPDVMFLISDFRRKAVTVA